METRKEYYSEFIEMSKETLIREIKPNHNLSNSTIKCFISFVQDALNILNEVSASPEEIYQLDLESNVLYEILDEKYRSILLTSEGFHRMNRSDIMSEIDIYWNFFTVTKCPSYLFVSLENAPREHLEIIDFIYYKSGKENQRPRYETYLCAFKTNIRKNPKFLSDKEIARLGRICSKDMKMKDIYDEIISV